jgi:carboxypeptidase family protein
MTSNLFELKGQFEELQKKYREYLPKVDPALIDDLLLRQMENPEAAPMYMVEVFLEPGIDGERVREMVLQETGTAPAIYDNGTHIAAHHRLTLEMLKRISEKEGVIEVTGEYSGDFGNWSASHEHDTHEKWHPPSLAERSLEAETRAANEVPREQRKNDYRMAAYVSAGIVGAIALAGFIISGGLVPNANVGRTIPAGIEPGLLHGYVSGPEGLPAVGATVLAVQQGTDSYASAFVSVNGQYLLNLAPGNYIVYVAYPDGTDKTATVDVQRGASLELNFAY